MPTAPANAAGIELYYETHGDPDGVPLLLVMGLGAQLIAWDLGFVEGLVDRGFYVIRFDNRDVGLSTKPDVGAVDVGALLMQAFGGVAVVAPYSLADMADDAFSLLDQLGIESAHIVGASMGGMIVQTMAIAHPERVRSLTSIMSTTGDPDVGTPDPSVLPMLLAPPATDRAGAIAQGIEGSRAIGAPMHFDEEATRERVAAAYDRSFYPEGTGHQLLAIVSTASRSEGLRTLDIPTLVIHGEIDPLVTVSGGKRTAEVIPGAELMLFEDMAHDLPTPLWAQIIEAITALAARTPSPAS